MVFVKGNIEIYPSQFSNKLWLQNAWLQDTPERRKGLRRSGSPHLTVAMENRINTLALLVFPSKIMCGECISPPVLKCRNHSSNMVQHVYSALYPFFFFNGMSQQVVFSMALPSVQFLLPMRGHFH